MSKTLEITVHTAVHFRCSVRNVAAALERSGWRLADSDGRIEVWNNAADDWEFFSGSSKEFLDITDPVTFRMYFTDNGEETSATVCIDKPDCFSLYPDNVRKCGGHTDFNWYYERITDALDRERCTVERISITEY